MSVVSLNLLDTNTGDCEPADMAAGKNTELPRRTGCALNQ